MEVKVTYPLLPKGIELSEETTQQEAVGTMLRLSQLAEGYAQVHEYKQALKNAQPEAQPEND